MSTFSKANFKTLNYNSFRPHYPALFYKILGDYASQTLGIKKAVDLGCGTGVATYPLLNFSDKVIGVDLSPKMVETANLLINERCDTMGISDKSRIHFVAGSVESLAYDNSNNRDEKIFGNGDLDLITAAQCIHWFQDYPTFFQSIAKLLKPGGTLAYWYYIDSIVVDYKGSNLDSPSIKTAKLEKSWQIVSKYLYDDPNFAGPHWEQPGRGILRDHLEKVDEAIPKDLFTDIKINKFISDISDPQKTFPSVENGDLKIVMKDLPIGAIKDYHSTASGIHNYKEVHGDNAIDIPSQILKEWESELGWGEDTTVDYVFHSGYTFMRKK